MTGRKLTGLDKDGEEAVTAPPSNPPQSKLEEYDMALEVTKGLLSNLSEHVTSVENQVMLLSQKQLLDSQLLQLQESFMNFTRQVYQLQHWRVTSADRGKTKTSTMYSNTTLYVKRSLFTFIGSMFAKGSQTSHVKFASVVALIFLDPQQFCNSCVQCIETEL